MAGQQQHVQKIGGNRIEKGGEFFSLGFGQIIFESLHGKTQHAVFSQMGFGELKKSAGVEPVDLGGIRFKTRCFKRNP